MRRIFLFIAGCCCFLIPSAAYACSCATSDPASEFNDAKAIFIGRMLGGTEKISLKDEHGKAFSIEAGRVRFTVEEIFKGDLASEATIQISSMKGTSCGPYGLKRGALYLVYAYGDEDDPKALYSGVCTRTQLATSSETSEDLDFLRSLPPAGTGGNLRGAIWLDVKKLPGTGGSASPLANVKVKIQGAGAQPMTVTTDQNGRFEASRLKPGQYKVELELPPDYTSKSTSAEVKIDDRGTASVGFEVYYKGGVSGHVLDKDGRGFNSIFLNLESEESSVYGHSRGEGGAFLAQGVPPGEYVLYIEMQQADYKKNAKYYYPGTFRREDATVIKVGLGQQVEGIEFLLPDDFKVRTIEGRVVWADGRPAAAVQVMLLCPKSAKPDGHVIEFGPSTVETDEQGRFRLEGFTGEVYWIEARGEKKGSGKDELMHSPSRKLVLSENLNSVNLVLSKKGFSEACGK